LKKRGVSQGSAEDDHAGDKEHQRLEREGCEDQAERQHRSEIGDKAGGENRLSVFSPVEAEFEHHRVDDGNGGRRHRDAREPAWHDIPAQHEARRRGAGQERNGEACKADSGRLTPFQFEYGRIELGAGQEGQHDRADARQELDP